MSVTFRIALRYLFSRKSHSAVNIISMVSMAGIALATTVMIVVMSVFNGFHALIANRLSILDAPVYAVPTKGKVIRNATEIIVRLDSLSTVDHAFPAIEERALAVYDDRQIAVQLRGISEAQYPAFDSICPVGNPWAQYHPMTRSGVISVGVANELQLPIGSESMLRIYVPKRKGRINPANPMAAFRVDSIAPSAVFISNQPELDNNVVFIAYEQACRLLQQKNCATRIAIYPHGDVEDAVAEINKVFDGELSAKTLMELQSGAFQIVNMEKWLTFMLLGFILVIASFNVISSLSLLIIEKEPNAQVLQAIGASSSQVRHVYLLEGLLITSIGTLIGLVAGTILSVGQEMFGWVKLSGADAQLSLTSYPVEFHVLDLLPVAILSIAVGYAASFIAIKK